MKRFLFLIFIVLPNFAISQTDFEKAEKLFLSKNYDQSRIVFENILKESPNNIKTIEYLGDIAGQNKSWDNAIYYYKKLKH